MIDYWRQLIDDAVNRCRCVNLSTADKSLKFTDNKPTSGGFSTGVAIPTHCALLCQIEYFFLFFFKNSRRLPNSNGRWQHGKGVTRPQTHATRALKRAAFVLAARSRRLTNSSVHRWRSSGQVGVLPCDVCLCVVARTPWFVSTAVSCCVRRVLYGANTALIHICRCVTASSFLHCSNRLCRIHAVVTTTIQLPFDSRSTSG